MTYILQRRGSTIKFAATAFVFLLALCGPIIAHATTYYVSNSGSDSNNGTSTSTPWQSLAKVNAAPLLPGDSVLFQAGNAWSGQLLPNRSGSSPSSVITYGAYGSGAAPVINGNGVLPATVYITTQQYLVIDGLAITNFSTSRNFRNGILIDNATTSPLNYIHLTNLKITNVSGEAYVGQAGYTQPGDGAIVITGLESSATSRVDNVLVDTVTIDTVDDAGVLILCRNQSARAVGVVVQNVTVNNAGGNGILVGTTSGAMIQHNKVTNGGSRSTASAGLWPVYSDNSIVQYNEVSGQSTLANDGYAYDFDGQNSNAIFQYNYSHDNPFGFIEFFLRSSGVVRYNISQNDGTTFGYLGYPTNSNFSIYNNTIYIPPGSTSKVVFVGGTIDNTVTSTFKNNIISNWGTGTYDAVNGASWDHNIFFGNHPSSEPSDSNKLTVDPLLLAPGTATSLTNASGYNLRTSSPSNLSGVLISNNGGLDYFGNSVSSATAPSRGAFNGTPVLAAQPAPAVRPVDDATTGTGKYMVNYTGSWGHCSPCGGDPAAPPLWSGSNSWSKTSGNSASIAFTGTQASLYAVKDTNEGIANVSIDGGTQTSVDLYSPLRKGNTIVWTSPTLSAGSHVLTVSVTGTKNSSASDTFVALDRFTIAPTADVIIDDSVTGSGQNQVNYSGSWGHCNPCGGDPANPPLYNASNSWSNSSGNTATIAFTGTQAELYFVKDSNEGIANVSVDGGATTPVDLYSMSRIGNISPWTTPILAYGAHTVTITVTGNKNPSANNSFVALDRVNIFQ